MEVFKGSTDFLQFIDINLNLTEIQGKFFSSLRISMNFLNFIKVTFEFELKHDQISKN